MNASLLLTGIGLRAEHYAAFLDKRPNVAWLEIHSENYFGEGGKPLRVVETLRQEYPISLHGVGLSLGSSDDLNWLHLKQLRDLAKRIDPCLISEHLSWSSLDGQYFHDLFPLPFTEECLNHLVTRIQTVQDYLGKQILIENISSYAAYAESNMDEAAFLCEVAHQSGCGILLDVNNVYVSACNLHFDPIDYIHTIPSHLVQEIHLAGFMIQTVNQQPVLIDTHNKPVLPAVWELYKETIQHLGKKPTIIEWDKDLPALETLCLEAYRAEQIMRETDVPTKHTA